MVAAREALGPYDSGYGLRLESRQNRLADSSLRKECRLFEAPFRRVDGAAITILDFLDHGE